MNYKWNEKERKLLEGVVIGALDSEDERQVEAIRADESERGEEETTDDGEKREPGDRDE